MLTHFINYGIYLLLFLLEKLASNPDLANIFGHEEVLEEFCAICRFDEFGNLVLFSDLFL